MTQTSMHLTEALGAYLTEISEEPSDLHKALIAETSKLTLARMQISPEQAQFMSMVVSMVNPERILEIGTFTGYSSLIMAESSNDRCRITTCDMSEEFTQIAQRYWKSANVDHKIELRLGNALEETLPELIKENKSATFDLIFIDADKENYPGYLQLTKKLLKTGGMLLVDNVFWGGRVIDEHSQDLATNGVRELNQMLKQDNEMQQVVIPISDGLTLAKKL